MPRTMNDPLDWQIGQRIRALPMAQNMSQTELGRRMGVSFQQIQKYEKGLNRVGGSRLGRGARCQRSCSVRRLGGTWRQKSMHSLPEMMIHPYAARLLDAFFPIQSKSEQRAILAMVQAMASNSGVKRRTKVARSAAREA
jgi:transcriptional regulator with XRE-family HTH domain